MKKTYIVPEMTVVEIQTACSMLQASQFDLNSSKVNGSSALSRRGGGGWDDDDE